MPAYPEGMRALVATCLVALGCGGGDDEFSAPSCAAGEVAVEGMLAGESHGAGLSGAGSYIFINALGGDPGNLTVGSGEMLSLTWPDLVANGDSVDARGHVVIGDLDYGNCDADGYPGTLRMDEGGDGGSFRLVDLRPGADCAAATVEGELVGCFRSPN